MKKGDIYIHTASGGLYTYIGIATTIQHISDNNRSYIAKHEETGEEVNIAVWALNVYVSMLDHPTVLYKSHKDGQLWARPVDKFFGNNDYGAKRFMLYNPGEPQ